METTGKTTLPSTGCASDGTDMEPRRRAYLFARRSSQSLSVRGPEPARYTTASHRPDCLEWLHSLVFSHKAIDADVGTSM